MDDVIRENVYFHLYDNLIKYAKRLGAYCKSLNMLNKLKAYCKRLALNLLQDGLDVFLWSWKGKNSPGGQSVKLYFALPVY